MPPECLASGSLPRRGRAVCKPPLKKVQDFGSGLVSGSRSELVPAVPSRANPTAIPNEGTSSRTPGTAGPFRVLPVEAVDCHNAIMKYRLSLIVATGGFLGYLPGAPGTFASIATALAYYGVCLFAGSVAPELHISVLSVFTVLGVLASDHIVKTHGEHDPSFIVVDEIAGQWAALLLVPARPPYIAAGVLLFRIFDIWKPFGIRRLESLKNGVGILADDLSAGLLACVLLHAGSRLPAIWH